MRRRKSQEVGDLSSGPLTSEEVLNGKALSVIIAPAGKPPIEMPTDAMDSEAWLDWGRRCCALPEYRESREFLSTRALAYWARQRFSVHTDEWKHVNDILSRTPGAFDDRLELIVDGLIPTSVILNAQMEEDAYDISAWGE